MKLQTSCPSCATTLSVEADLVGKHAKCPKCQHQVRRRGGSYSQFERSIEQADVAVESVADGPTTVGARPGTA